MFCGAVGVQRSSFVWKSIETEKSWRNFKTVVICKLWNSSGLLQICEILHDFLDHPLVGCLAGFLLCCAGRELARYQYFWTCDGYLAAAGNNTTADRLSAPTLLA